MAGMRLIYVTQDPCATKSDLKKLSAQTNTNCPANLLGAQGDQNSKQTVFSGKGKQTDFGSVSLLPAPIKNHVCD